MQAPRLALLPLPCRLCAPLPQRSSRLAVRNQRWLSNEPASPAAPAPSTTEAAPTGPTPLPRWRQTPARMKAIGPHPQSKKVVPYQVNEDPAVLSNFYERLLDSKVEAAAIPEEVQWVAVTHKSFDHGRRGFNERLAFLGKQIVSLQATLGRLYSATSPPATQRDPSDRPPPFEHADYKGLENLAPADSDEHERSVNALLVRAAKRSEITKVMRWRPRDIADMQKSGEDAIALTTVLGVIGAVSLSCGGDTAAAVTRKLLRNY